jgi:hypothetical protein
MKIIVSSMLLVLAIFTTQGGYADQSPESIVTCANHPFFVFSHTVPGAVNTELCTWEHSCATCIPSLEDQGCKVVNVVVKPWRVSDNPTDYCSIPMVSYFLSCNRP